MALILVLAAVLRLGWPGLTEFKADEARLLALALDMAQGIRFPLRGISSSVGWPNFPMSVWLYALPLVVWPHVYAATLFTGLLNTLAVLGCWWFTRRYWGAQAAVVAALLFATSPWAVAHSRKIWAQNLLPFFVMAWAISGALAFHERRPRFLALHLLSLAVAVQVHLAAVSLVPVTLVLLVIFRRRLAWRPLVAGLGLSLLTALPFLYYLIRESAITGGIVPLPAVSDTKATLNWLAFRYAGLLTTGREIHALAGPEAFRVYLERAPELTAVHLLWGLLAAAGIVRLAWEAWRGFVNKKMFSTDGHRWTQMEVKLLVVLWALGPLLFFTWQVTPVALHYLLPIYPAPYIAAGVVAAAVIKRLSLPARAAGWGILGLAAAGQVWTWAALLAFISTNATPGGFGPPVAWHLQAAGTARQWLRVSDAVEILVAGPGESPALDEFAAIYDTLLRPLPRRFVNVSRSAVFPASPAVVVLAAGSDGEAARLYREAATRQADVALRAGEGALTVLALPAMAAPAPQHTLDPPPLLANFVTIVGYDGPVPAGDGTAAGRVHWRTGTPSTADYHFFNHLLDASGNRVSQADAAAFSATQWREGDVVVSVFHLPWPEQLARPLTLRVGMYTYPGVTSVPLLDVAGNPAAEAVAIPLP